MSVEEEARATFEEFAEGWNRHDAAAMAACWIEDGSVVDLWGKYALRRSGVQELLAGEHATPMRASSYRITAIRFEARGDDTLVAECDAVIDNVLAPNGRSYELKHQLNAVLVREGERWRFLSAHPSRTSTPAAQ